MVKNDRILVYGPILHKNRIISNSNSLLPENPKRLKSLPIPRLIMLKPASPLLALKMANESKT